MRKVFAFPYALKLSRVGSEHHAHATEWHTQCLTCMGDEDVIVAYQGLSSNRLRAQDVQLPQCLH